MDSEYITPSIRLAAQSDSRIWDDYILAHHAATPYHLFAWKEAVEGAYGFKSYYLMAVEQNDAVGVLPLFFLKIPLGGGALVALPYCDVGGPLTNDETIERSLLQAAVKLGLRLNANSIDIRGAVLGSALHSTQYFIEEKQDKVRMLLSLPPSSEELWLSFPSKLRSQVNKAKKNGLTFSFSQDLEAFYHIFASNMHELGSPVHSFAWIRSVLGSYGGRAKLGLVYHGQKAIGGGVVLNTDRLISIPWASTLREFNNLSPNMLLYWNLLEKSVERGLAQFDFGRSTKGEGTYRFKAQWGAKPAPLAWHILNLRKKATAGDVSISHHVKTTAFNKRAFAAKLWRFLPIGLANQIGPVIRKFLSL